MESELAWLGKMCVADGENTLVKKNQGCYNNKKC